MSEYHPDVYEVLILLRPGRKWRSEIPARLTGALDEAIDKELVSSLAVLIRADTGKSDWLLCLETPGKAALFRHASETDSPPAGSTAEKPAKGKPGRPTELDDAREIVREFDQGKADGLWKTQAEYLRKRHAKRYREDPKGLHHGFP